MSAMAERRAFRGETLEDALRLVRDELGPDAIVVRQREGIVGGVGGFFGRRCVELEVEAPAEPAGSLEDLWAEDSWSEPMPTTPRTLPARSVVDLYDSGEKPEREPASAPAAQWPMPYGPPATFTTPLDDYLSAADDLESVTEEIPALEEPEPESPLLRTLHEQASPFADELAQAVERAEPALSLVVTEPAREPSLLPVPVSVFDPDGMTRRLVTAGLEGRLARDVVAEAESELRLFDPTRPFEQQVRTALARRIRVARASRRKSRRVIALVGPPGSGKTLTAARLCHVYRTGVGSSVAALSLEPIREAFVLAQHTKGLGVELAAADDASTLAIELQKLETAEVVVVDTPAVDPQDEERLGMLALLLDLVGAHETHLLMPASLNATAARDLLEAVAPLGVDRLLLTHQDGPGHAGVGVAAAVRAKLPISFTATGGAWGLRPADAYELAGSVVL
jgi:flagellar biosynthesis GTPase FlhF